MNTDIAAIEARHGARGNCACQPYPCDARRLLDELAEVQRDLDETQAEFNKQNSELGKAIMESYGASDALAYEAGVTAERARITEAVKGLPELPVMVIGNRTPYDVVTRRGYDRVAVLAIIDPLIVSERTTG